MLCRRPPGFSKRWWRRWGWWGRPGLQGWRPYVCLGGFARLQKKSELRLPSLNGLRKRSNGTVTSPEVLRTRLDLQNLFRTICENTMPSFPRSLLTFYQSLNHGTTPSNWFQGKSRPDARCIRSHHPNRKSSMYFYPREPRVRTHLTL